MDHPSTITIPPDVETIPLLQRQDSSGGSISMCQGSVSIASIGKLGLQLTMYTIAISAVAFVVLTFLCAIASPVADHKPVIIFHGILDSAESLRDLKDNIETSFPGTPVYVIDLFDNFSSFNPMWKQVEGVRNVTRSIMKSAKAGVNIIGYSQGGLLARAIIQTTDDHNVDTFIALSAPLNGQFGDTSYLRHYFPEFLKEDLYEFFYSSYGQKWSVGNYWKDPHHLQLYREYSNFLAQLNNEATTSKSRFEESWKSNFQRLKKLVLIGGPSDGVITPWQSALFGCYDRNETVVPMRELEIYKKDSFGLRSLDETKSIVECVVPGVEHVKWHGNPLAFAKCIAPHL